MLIPKSNFCKSPVVGKKDKEFILSVITENYGLNTAAKMQLKFKE